MCVYMSLCVCVCVNVQHGRSAHYCSMWAIKPRSLKKKIFKNFILGFSFMFFVGVCHEGGISFVSFFFKPL